MEKQYEVYVEDMLASCIVKVVWKEAGILNFTKVVVFGDAGNAFSIAAGLGLQGQIDKNKLILIDGDVYTTVSEILKQIKKNIGGTEAGQKMVANNTSDDIHAIRGYLSIRGDVSISYDFIKEQRLQDQLKVDNLRMENAALNLNKDEVDRFYIFCINAFYQVENIINYYFYTTFPDIDNLLSIVEMATKNDGEYSFKRKEKQKEKSVGDIPVYYKINAICNMLFPENISIEIFFSNLRKVRNEGEHRCHVLYEEKGNMDQVSKFLHEQTFDSVRSSLMRIVEAVRENVGKSYNPTMEPPIKNGVITQILPSACFVSIGNEIIQLPNKLFYKVKEKRSNDNIVCFYAGDELVDIE